MAVLLFLIARWKQLCSIPQVVVSYRKNPNQPGVKETAQEIIENWRARLMDISWLIRFLNEHLARKANEEDDCKGRFWEGRFKSQALLDEAAVITAMSYVDLNPIRAKMAKTPEASDYTSVQQRMTALKENKPESTELKVPLVQLSSSHQQTHENSFPFSLADYLQLVDYAGRVILQNKRGFIEPDTLS